MDYNTLPTKQTIDQTLANLNEHGILAQFVDNKEQALEAVKKLIPDGVPVMTGASKTLEQIGFVDLLKSGQHPWKNLKVAIVAETDKAKQVELRRQATLSEYFLGSVHAITQDGQTITASASGSQIPSYAFSSNYVIWVAGAQKIVTDLDEGFRRVREYVFPLEDQHMKDLGFKGSSINEMLIFSRTTNPTRKVHLILVNEALGY